LFPNFIAGERVTGASASTNINPSDTGDVIGEFASATAAETNAAIAAARAAAPAWRAFGPVQRGEILNRAAAEINERHSELADLLAREEGKTLAEAGGEVTRAAQVLAFHAAQTTRNVGEFFPSIRPGMEVLTSREPVGVVGIITPWNFPIAIPAWKIAPALAYGNTVVFKPAGLVTASAWHLVDILQRAGLPSGVLNLVMGGGAEVGATLAASPDIDAISFTGSVQTGRRIMQAAQEHGTKVQLEMGGKNPLIIADDADLDLAVSIALDGAYGSTGQRCTASSRLIAMRGVHDAFAERMVEAVARIRVGDSRDAGTGMGPVVEQGQLDQNQRYIDIAREEGGEVIGGELLQRRTPGFYMAPALVLGTRNDMTINREEVFGPVASIISADDYEHAVAIANDTEFGLSSGIVTTSLSRAHHFRAESRAGMVMINTATAGVDFHAPFGGRHASSYGSREQGRAAQDFFTTIKTSYFNSGTPS